MTPAEIIAAAEAAEKNKTEAPSMRDELNALKRQYAFKKEELQELEARIEQMENTLLRAETEAQVEYDREHFDEVKKTIHTESHQFSGNAQDLFEKMNSGEDFEPAFDL